MKMSYHAGCMLATVLAMALTSCVDDDDNTLYYSDYCTITGSMTEGYTLYSDAGDVLIPDLTSIYSSYGVNGFGTRRRGFFQFSFDKNNVSERADGRSTYRQMSLLFAQGLNCKEPITLSQADSLHVSDADSIWSFTPGSVWLTRGFLNVTWHGYYSIVGGVAMGPTLHLVYDPSLIATDSIGFTMYYNRHDTQPSTDDNSLTLVDCFDVSGLVASIPGSDSITVSVCIPDGTPVSSRIARSEFVLPY